MATASGYEALRSSGSGPTYALARFWCEFPIGAFDKARSGIVFWQYRSE
jgi:hypothetical protein